MPRHTGELAVHGRLEQREEKVLLVVDERLSGHDTFLSTTLRLDRPVHLPELPVRILTFDDVTVLAPSTLPCRRGRPERGGAARCCYRTARARRRSPTTSPGPLPRPVSTPAAGRRPKPGNC